MPFYKKRTYSLVCLFFCPVLVWPVFCEWCLNNSRDFFHIYSKFVIEKVLKNVSFYLHSFLHMVNKTHFHRQIHTQRDNIIISLVRFSWTSNPLFLSHSPPFGKSDIPWN